MRPKKPPVETQKQKELFQVELAKIIDKNHPLVKPYHPQTGRPACGRQAGDQHPTHGIPSLFEIRLWSQ